MRSSLLTVILVFFTFLAFAQNNGEVALKVNDSIARNDRVIDPLSPAKAAFYSAVVPGLGQAYNKKYWKIPIVYAGMGAGIYFYLRNDKQYDRYRNAYKRRLAGFTDDEFYDQVNNQPLLTDSALIEAQRFYSRNKEVSLLVTAAFYILNIVDANVDAHLMQFNVDENLSLKPDVYQNGFDNKANLRLSLNYRF